MKIFLVKSKNGGLYPADEEARGYIKRRKPGQAFSCVVTQVRNYPFLQKFMVMIGVIHDALPEPESIVIKGREIQPISTKDSTREFLTVAAGYRDVYGYPDGKVRVRAKSIAYENMKEEEFEKLYSAVIDAALRNLPAHWSEDELNRVANEILRFD